MRTQDPTALRITSGGILVVEGFGTSLSVQSGQLLVRTGSGRTVRTARFERAGRTRLRRLVIVGRTGAVTLPALDWVMQVGASWTWIARDGETLGSSAKLGLDDGRLRRAQALAPLGESGPRIIRHLLGTKIEGQLRVLRSQFPERRREAATVQAALQALKDAQGIDDLMLAESSSAAAYWAGWKGLSLTIARRDLPRVPPRWISFDSRASLVTGNPRLSTDPIGSLLNLAYGLLEAEARVSMATAGLDAGLALGLHSDQRARANGALDLMEPARPAADELVLEAIRSHTFRRGDFHELRNGVCRIAPALARMLIEAWVPSLSAAIAPHAEQVAAMLAQDAGVAALPTWLTGSNRSKGRDGIRVRPPRAFKPKADIPKACRSCGLILEDRRRSYCDDCRPAMVGEAAATFASQGRRSLADMRVRDEHDPARTPEAKVRLGQAIARRNAEAREWERTHDHPDPAEWDRIYAGLREASVGMIQRAIGVSPAYAWRIKRGERRPHVRHWEALRSLSP